MRTSNWSRPQEVDSYDLRTQFLFIASSNQHDNNLGSMVEKRQIYEASN